MLEFPTEEEEFEFNYGNELEMVNDILDEDLDLDDSPQNVHARRSLNFEDPAFPRSLVPDTAVPGPSWASDTSPYCKQKKRKNEEVDRQLLSNCDENDMEHRELKKSKVGNEEAELINKILATRNDLKEQSLGTSAAPESKDTREGISKHVPKWPFISVTTTTGDRWYLRLNSIEFLDLMVKMALSENENFTLLSNFYGGLWEEAKQVLKKKKHCEYEAAFERRLQALEEAPDSGCEMISVDEEQSQLWVEKYKPCTYLDLLSDETTNRYLLRWLTLWDRAVFKRENVMKHKWKGECPNKASKKVLGKFDLKNMLNEELDENGCPKNKVALLCGPPGLGKTTLAHLVAKHAGYNVVEMNASDDRSPEAFRLQLEAATQMRAVIGEEPRPNCLVIDEIDGAPAAAIEVLVKYLNGKDIGKKKEKKKAELKLVHRPVICICNDAYVPALRSLRQMAFILQFPPTFSNKLAQRLLEVACKQGLRTDMGAMLALSDKTQNDIRSCLSVLQFFKGRGQEVRLSDIQKSTVGQKDIQKSLFSVWQDIFQIQKPKRKTNASPTNNKLYPMPDIEKAVNSGEDLSAIRMEYVLNTVQHFGDYERVSQGVFENYLNMKLKDSRLKAVSEGLEWFCYFDEITSKMNTTQNYSLMPYLPYISVKWHFQFASFAWPKIMYPRTGYEMLLRTTQCQQVVATLQRGMTAGVRTYTGTGGALLQDLIPLLPDLVAPSPRPITVQLYKKKESEDVAHSVNIMIDYNLTYVQHRTAEGSYDFALDPNIEELALFPDGRERQMLSYSCKQLLAHEVELERIRRAEICVPASTAAPTARAAHPASAFIAADSMGPVKPNTDVASSSLSSPTDEKPLPNHLQKLTARPIREDRAAKDFFGRIVVQKKEPCPTDIRRDEIVKGPIWFHFKEGFSNAVRRYVHMSELL